MRFHQPVGLLPQINGNNSTTNPTNGNPTIETTNHNNSNSLYYDDRNITILNGIVAYSNNQTEFQNVNKIINGSETYYNLNDNDVNVNNTDLTAHKVNLFLWHV